MSKLSIVIIAAAACLSGPAALAAALSPAQIVARHMGAFDKHNLDAIVGDYADDAVMIQPAQTFQGKAAIRKFFAPMADPKAPRLVSKPATVDGDVATATWTLGAGTPAAMSGKDVFVIRGGKIHTQAVFIDLPAK
jgi:ketosteroid isomerase-like protein